MYCSKCGCEVSGATAFCPKCGQPTGSISPTAYVAPTMASAPGAVAPANYGGVQYAGFWLRFVAHLIDSVVLLVGFCVILIPLAILTGLGSALGRIHPGEDPGDLGELFGLIGFTFIFVFLGITIVGSWLYYAMLESSIWQATVGEKALSLKVTDMTGQPISFGRASGRHFGKIITGLIPFAIGYILAGFTERKQAIHDMIASCLVLRQG